MLAWLINTHSDALVLNFVWNIAVRLCIMALVSTIKKIASPLQDDEKIEIYVKVETDLTVP